MPVKPNALRGDKPVYYVSSEPSVPRSSGVDVSSLPDSYSELVKANPYLNYNYTPGFWDSIGNAFGFRTREDKFREEMELAAREYDQQLLSMHREEEYNSPLQQAARQREAGINPDLNGVESSMASEFNEPEISPVPPEGGEGLQFVGNLMSAVTTALGIAQGVTDLRGSIIDNDLKDASFVSQLFGFGRDAFLNSITPESLRKVGSSVDENGNPVLEVSQVGIDPSFFHSRSSQKRFFRAMNRAAESVKGQAEAYGLAKQAGENRQGYARIHGSKYYSTSDDELDEVFGIIGDVSYDILEKGLRLESRGQDVKSFELESEGRNVAADLANGLPELQSESDAEALKYSKENVKVQNEINESMRDVVHKLHEKAEDGNKLAAIVLGLIGMAGPLSSAIRQNF